jgi:hypothetical protein
MRTIHCMLAAVIVAGCSSESPPVWTIDEPNAELDWLAHGTRLGPAVFDPQNEDVLVYRQLVRNTELTTWLVLPPEEAETARAIAGGLPFDLELTGDAAGVDAATKEPRYLPNGGVLDYLNDTGQRAICGTAKVAVRGAVSAGGRKFPAKVLLGLESARLAYSVTGDDASHCHTGFWTVCTNTGAACGWVEPAFQCTSISYTAVTQTLQCGGQATCEGTVTGGGTVTYTVGYNSVSQSYTVPCAFTGQCGAGWFFCICYASPIQPTCCPPVQPPPPLLPPPVCLPPAPPPANCPPKCTTTTNGLGVSVEICETPQTEIESQTQPRSDAQ